MEIGNLAQWAAVFVNGIVAVLAVWGDAIRSRCAGPSLSVSLLNPEGERTHFTGGIPTRYYHLRVKNGRRWASAKNVRVVLIRLARIAADQYFRALPSSGPLQLNWQHANIKPQFPTLGPDDTCDLGFLLSDSGFNLTFYGGMVPNNFQGVVRANERMRVEIQVLADNAESKPLFLEIAWDGVWSEDTVEMRRHLVVMPVSSLEGQA